MKPASVGARHSPLNSLLVDAIREAIVAGRYRPGERLVEERLAEDFGVSRIPVREALRTLSAAGLVSIEPRKGASVALLSRETARETIEVRAMLEALNARLAARHIHVELIARLEAVLARGNAAAAAGSQDSLTVLNAEYHELLAEAGMNRILGDLMRQLRERTAAYFDASGEDAARNWREHAEILGAVIDGNEERAARLASDHVLAAAHAFSSKWPSL